MNNLFRRSIHSFATFLRVLVFLIITKIDRNPCFHRSKRRCFRWYVFFSTWCNRFLSQYFRPKKVRHFYKNIFNFFMKHVTITTFEKRRFLPLHNRTVNRILKIFKFNWIRMFSLKQFPVEKQGFFYNSCTFYLSLI